MKNSLLAIFDEIWPMTLYYSTGTLARFWSNLKNWYSLEGRNFGELFLVIDGFINLAKIGLIVQGHWPNFIKNG